MDDFIAYLSESLGLKVTSKAWDFPKTAPIFLKAAAEYRLCSCSGKEFVAAFPKGGESLPELKRIPTQLSRHTELPVVLVCMDIDSRQRRALVSQGIPLIVPGKLAYLPFLALAASAAAERRAYDGKLSGRAQAAFVTIIANSDIASAYELRNVTGLSASTVSRAIDELCQHGLLQRGKKGRDVVFTRDTGRNVLLRKAMPFLASPVERSIFVEATEKVADFPDAGESALAARSMLGFPKIKQKAISKKSFGHQNVREVLEGELPDTDTVELQLWTYEPLIAGLGRIDDVSLAASLAGLDDERINGELDRLFEEDGLWQKAAYMG
jgi:hypothetical protein